MGDEDQVPPGIGSLRGRTRNAGRLRLVSAWDGAAWPQPTVDVAPPPLAAPAVSPPHRPLVADEGESLLYPQPQAFWVRLAVGAGTAPGRFARWQLAVKRFVDVVLGVLLLVLTLPVIAVAAVAIKVHDGGPVLYRQRRVGRHGRDFTILKLRTMMPDADKHLPLLIGGNVRTGPLFKMLVDPRVTPVGRILRSSSIDELPQLVNVIRGTMSLVGPRPALPAEVAQFDDQLMARLDVKPGITGLWQVEARDDPAFERYQKLDLYYVRHWSTRLDLAILLSTVLPVGDRLWRSARGKSAQLSLGKGEDVAASPVLD